RRQIDHFAIRRNGHAIAAAFVRLFPEYFVGGEVKTRQRSGRADIEPMGGRVCANAFDIQRLAFFVQPRDRNAFHESVAVVDVEYQHALPAVFEVITNAGLGHIKKTAFGWLVAVSRQTPPKLRQQKYPEERSGKNRSPA